MIHFILACCLATGANLEGRIVAIGDVHGDIAATRDALELAGVLDASDHWIGGTCVVVQTGDQLDRGNDEPDILDLFDRLRAGAQAAGGAFIVLNGNHELMNARLDFRYVTAEGYADFAAFSNADMGVDSVIASLPDSVRGRARAFRPGGPLARRLASRDVWTRVGGTLFVHGGLLPEHLDYGLDRINDETRAWLEGRAPYPAVLAGSESPVWTRRYSDDVDDAACADVSDLLERVGADRIVVGHSVQDGGITAYCGGRIWCIDVGLADAYGGPMEVLEIVGTEVRVLRAREDEEN